MRVLILGGYGFIGAEIMRALTAAGFDCVGLGRSPATGKRLVPEAEWIGADIATLDAPQKWAAKLAGMDAVVNAAGALQDGPRDHLAAIHHHAIAALVEAAAAADVRRFVQISAPGAELDASTAFMRSKAAGDAAVRAAGLNWTILKPGLVLGRSAYGGTALLRLLAGLPVATPLVSGSARVQTVSIDDVAAAVVAVLNNETPACRDFDLVEDDTHSLRDIVRGMRRQIGFPPARFEPDVPLFAARLIGAVADFAGFFGWRSALRSTALTVMSEEVIGDPKAWREATGRSLKSLEETLAAMPGTAQDRLYARAQLALPVMTVTLAGFWIASGVVGWFQLEKAAALVSDLGEFWSKSAVAAGSFVDVLVGGLMLNQRTARAGATLSVGVSLIYLFLGTMIAPHFWADPLGVYVKIIPAIALGLAVALMLEER